MNGGESAILHVDMDAFFASVEQRDDPSLAGRPVIVGGTGARGVVAAASYEVRRFGVRSAMPTRRARMLCPQAVCVPPRMQRYREISRRVFGIFHEITPIVEGLSLDEAYLDVTASRALKGNAVEIACLIKERIRITTGLTASVGVAPNKLVAKIASDMNKPDGLTVVPAEEVQAFLDPLSLRRMPGLGRRTGERLEAAGLRTLGELRRATDSVLWPIVGRYAQRVRDRAAGIDERPVVADWEEKSISTEETFATDVSDPRRLHAELARLADRSGARLRTKRLLAGCVQVKIRRHDFTTFSRQSRLAPPTSDSQVIAAVASGLLARWLQGDPGAKLRLLGVGVSELAPAEQLELFSAGTAPQPRLDATLDRIRERFGTGALGRASSLRPIAGPQAVSNPSRRR